MSTKARFTSEFFTMWNLTPLSWSFLRRSYVCSELSPAKETTTPPSTPLKRLWSSVRISVFSCLATFVLYLPLGLLSEVTDVHTDAGAHGRGDRSLLDEDALGRRGAERL